MSKKSLQFIAIVSFFFLNTTQIFGQEAGDTFQYGGLSINRPVDKNVGGGGFGLALGLNYMLNDNLSVGVEGLGALNFLSEKNQTDPETNFSLWYGGKAVSDFYFTTGTVRPFVGVGAGAIKSGGVSNDGLDKSKIRFLAAPRAGILLGNFRISVDYSLIPSKLVTSTNEFNLSYIGINLGAIIGI